MSDWPDSVTKKDLRIEYFRGSGAGGQHRNKKDTACRITHIPTGLFSSCQEHKSQKQNLKTAFKRLADQLIPIMKKEEMKERYSAGNNRVRTYNEKYNRVTDERISDKIYTWDEVFNGNGLDKIIQELKDGRRK